MQITEAVALQQDQEYLQWREAMDYHSDTEDEFIVLVEFLPESIDAAMKPRTSLCRSTPRQGETKR